MRSNSNLAPAVIALILWAAVMAALGGRGIFQTTPTQVPIGLLLAVVLPAALFGTAYALSTGFKAYVLGLDLRWLTAIQGWRIIGAMFLVLMGFNLVPSVFAWPAGIGDTIVGLYAPFVLYALVQHSRNWRSHVVLLSILGLLDFVGAIGTGVLAGNNPVGFLKGPVGMEAMQRLPLSIIPTFGVPAWILVHWISLLKVSRGRASEFE